MPEGPQMVFLKEQLAHFIGQQILVAEGNAKDIPFDVIKGKELSGIKTFGKEILFCFPGFAIRVHLMLFGKFAIDGKLNRKLDLRLEFETGHINFYASKTRFIDKDVDEVYDWSTDVMNSCFNPNEALHKLQNKPKQLICEALLDQQIFAGVGNKIKNEVLFRTRIHPESIVGEIPVDELQKLVTACVKLSFEYLDRKREGTDDEHWEVYKKSECPRDHTSLIKEKIGKSGRSCYFCDKCQKLYVKDKLQE
ncbi:MAG TPA: endonuclease [Segetibacter sp.]|jgi:endonuclease-8